MQKAQPKILEIQKRWANDKEKLNSETARLYIDEGINPVAGLIPALI